MPSHSVFLFILHCLPLSFPVLCNYLMFMHAQLSNVVRHTVVNVDRLSKAPSALLTQKMSTLSGTHAHSSAFLSK